MPRKVEIELHYQPIIPNPPQDGNQLFKQAAANDGAAVNNWNHQWLANMASNRQIFGPFKNNSCASEFQKYLHGAAILAGSGPSLKFNAPELKNRGKIPLVSCLHNFHYFEDLDLKPEYYVTLDANPQITIEEVSEGGSRTPDEYWELTKERTLVAYIGSHPDLLKKWRGRILFYNANHPEKSFCEAQDQIEVFNTILPTGGNVLGACLSFSKTVLGATQSVFVGADFAFGHDSKFHPWNSKYDASMGVTMACKDIFGIPVRTWASYYGFKCYFESTALRVPGIYYNCTEGGAMGAYGDGNISAFRYMDLKDCLRILNMSELAREQVLNPDTSIKAILYP